MARVVGRLDRIHDRKLGGPAVGKGLKICTVLCFAGILSCRPFDTSQTPSHSKQEASSVSADIRLVQNEDFSSLLEKIGVKTAAKKNTTDKLAVWKDLESGVFFLSRFSELDLLLKNKKTARGNFRLVSKALSGNQAAFGTKQGKLQPKDEFYEVWAFSAERPQPPNTTAIYLYFDEAGLPKMGRLADALAVVNLREIELLGYFPPYVDRNP